MPSSDLKISYAENMMVALSTSRKYFRKIDENAPRLILCGTEKSVIIQSLGYDILDSVGFFLGEAMYGEC